MELRHVPTDAAPAVQVRGLAKRHGKTTALDHADLDVAEGTVMGVLGPNGASKTTLVRILSTLVRPDAGSALVAGWDVERQPRRLRRAIGLTGQYASVDTLLPGYRSQSAVHRASARW
jgi:oleandomycin transport system ATP-binding protein